MSDGKLVLMATGDIMLGEHPLYLRRGVKSIMEKESPSFPFAHVADTLKKADVVFGNLECSLSRGKVPEWRAVFSALPGSAGALRDAGFNVLSLANNHIMENGKQAVMDTMRILEDHGILCAGIGEDKHSVKNPVIVQLKQNKLAFLAYSLSPPFSSAPMPRAEDLYARGGLAEIKRDIKVSKNMEADVIIVSLHWGHEFIDSPSPRQVKLAHELVDSGVNLIIGHHPHVLQAVESYRGAVIAYSLGNFIFDIARSHQTKEGLILKCSLSRSQISDVELIPVTINRHFQPEIVDGSQADHIRNRLSNPNFPGEGWDSEQKQRQYDDAALRAMRQAHRWLWMFVLRNLGSFSGPTFLFLGLKKLRRIATGLARVFRKSA